MSKPLSHTERVVTDRVAAALRQLLAEAKAGTKRHAELTARLAEVEAYYAR